MSKDTRKNAPAGTVSADRSVKIERYKKPLKKFSFMQLPEHAEPGEADWADLNLAGLEILARSSASPQRTRIWQDGDRNWWRNPGSIHLMPWRDGQLRFTIYLLSGANRADVEWLEGRITAAQQGIFLRAGWDPKRYSDGREGWWFRYSRPYGDPFSGFDRSPEVEPCTDSRCTARWHNSIDVRHTAEEIMTDSYEIAVDAFDDGDYSVYVDCPSANMTASQIASFVSDLQWARAACEQVNAATSDPMVKGMRDAAGYWERRLAAERASEEVAA